MLHLLCATNALLADWCAVQEATIKRGSVQRSANAATSSWDLWTTFCSFLGLDALHIPDNDPVPLFHLFAQRYRTGAIAPGRQSVWARTAEDSLATNGGSGVRPDWDP